MKTLIVDNGSFELKAGYASDDVGDVKVLKNTIARTKDRRLLISNQLDTISDISGVTFKRAHEKGQLISWEVEKQVWDYAFSASEVGLDVDMGECDLVMSETPLQIPVLSTNSDQVVFEEYGFQSLYRAPFGALVPWMYQKNETLYEPQIKNDLSKVENYSDFQLVIDSGFNCTWVIPVIKGVVYWKSVRKLEIGGRFLSGVLREFISFRHYNVTDETILVNTIKEQSCFVTQDYNESLKQIKNSKDKSHILEYVLPDFNTTTKGYVLTPELRSKYKPQEQQILKLYDERFSVPETIFHPEIVDIKNKPGLIETIVDSVYSLPDILRPLVVSNIICIGGNFNMDGFSQRILNELKVVLPVEWEVRVGKPTNPSVYGWECAKKFTENEEFYKQVRVTKQDYDEHGHQWVQKRFGYQI